MILISHRGNVDGPKPDTENTIEAIEYALSLGFDVEIDVWVINDKFYIGHNYPTHHIKSDYLFNTKLWCHAKNIDALILMNKYNNIHYFWHEKDSYTVTSQKYIWSYTGMPINPKAICVLPEQYPDRYHIYGLKHSLGICSDYILKYRQLLP